ncbi:MAG: MlaD family protein [Saprospiraceae bacterium]|nr:MlaD family protein [Saprospiraceae bacterium]
MKKKSINAIKLGLFVLAGLSLLIFALYLLGKNKTFFGNRFELKAHFRDVNGLLVGNNVRFSGIDVGSVQSIRIVNDTVIEVTLNLNREIKSFIRNNAEASIGTDGLIGNRVVNIEPKGGSTPFVNGGEMLPTREEVRTEQMLQTLSKTNQTVAKISEEVLATVQMVRNSSELSSLLNDKTLSYNLRASLQNLHTTTKNASVLMENAVSTFKLASEGNGTIATLLTDTTLALEVRQLVTQINTLERSADRLVKDLNGVIESVEKDINQGEGSVNALMRDSVMADRLRATIENAERGTAAFAEDMEALKSNFLFRRYFKKLEKKAAKEKEKELSN